MKYSFTFVCVLLSCVLLAECQSMKDVIKSVRKCKEEIGASEDVLGALKQENLPETDEGFCVLACASKKIGVMTANNEIDTDKAVSLLETLHFDPNKVNSVVETCKSAVGSQTNECNAAKLFMQCMFKNKQ